MSLNDDENTAAQALEKGLKGMKKMRQKSQKKVQQLQQGQLLRSPRPSPKMLIL